MTLDPISTSISLASLAVSASVAWLTLLKPGRVKMLRPSLIAFLDARGVDGPKVWFRSLLYCTSRRGSMIESMFVHLRRGETRQNFSFWVCGERDKLASGCGMFLGRDGAALNHHFLPPKDGGRFEFLPGDYVLEVFVTVLHSRKARLLATTRLVLTEEHARALKDPDKSVYFDWWPDSARYNAHVVQQSDRTNLPEVLKNLLSAPAQPER